MAYDKFLIAPLNSGLETDRRPWLIPDEAFARLRNAYNFRGRIRKRFGGQLLQGSSALDPLYAQLASRLRIDVGTTNGSGNLSGTVPGATGAIGQLFSVGPDAMGHFEVFTVVALGTPGVMLATGSATVHTFDTSSGAFVITGSLANSDVYFYPALPVMGLITYERDTINDETLYAFDTRYAYVYSAAGTGGWQRLGTAAWTGTNADFFWGGNYRGANSYDNILFITNFVTADGMKYWDGSSWTDFLPQFNTAGETIVTARIILPFKDRLLLLNTIENLNAIVVGTTDASGNASGIVPGGSGTIGQFFTINGIRYTVTAAMGALTTTGPGSGTFDTTTGAFTFTGTAINSPIYFGAVADNIQSFQQRCRFSQNGDPTDTVNGWLEDIPGRGGYIDAPTKEAIISAEFLRDRLIVFFERSTWELVYIGNQTLPFVWQKINTELGSESTFSVVPFDKVVLGIGNVGIHACNGANVERIDDKIPQEVFEIQNENEGVERVYGIRDYTVEMVYWTFPSTDKEATTYPNQVLVYNYKTGTWAINDDTITVFGYYQNANDITWQSSNLTWQEDDNTWNSGTQQSLFRQVLAGNQEGFTFIVNPNLSRNSSSLQITNITIAANIVTFTVIDHNVQVGDFLYIDNIQASGTLPTLNGTIYPVYTVPGTTTFTINTLGTLLTGAYHGGGTLERVSNIDIRTKEFNFYNQEGSNVYIPKIVFYVEKTTDGEITANVYVSSADNYNLVDEGFITGTLLGTNVLETFPDEFIALQNMQNRFWHVCYFQAEGENVQIQLTFNSIQIRTPAIVFSDFELHAMFVYAMKTNQWF